MWQSPIAHARQCLDDHLALVRAADTRDSLRRRIVGLVRACQRNPYLRSILDGYETENARLDRWQEEQRDAFWSRLTEIAALARQQDEAFVTVSNAEWTAERVGNALAARAHDEPPAPFADGDESRLRKASQGLQLVLHALPEDSPARRGDASAMWQVGAVIADIEWLDQAREDARHAAASRIWAELGRAVELVGTSPNGDPLDHWRATFPTGLFAETHLSDDPRPEVGDLHRTVLERVEALVVELRLRLGARATHDAAIRRYAWGAVTFRREELFSMADDNTRQAEKKLTEDAARSLFAAGFDVLTEVSLGAIRLDLVSFGDALLIEAKRYGPRTNTTEHAVRKIIYAGAKQLHDYASRFRGLDLETDNYLLVFRLGGVRIDLPGEVAAGNTRLRFQVVDLAPATATGSKAPALVEVKPEEIVANLK